MGPLRFQIVYKSRGFNVPDDIKELLSDMSEPFQNIIEAWAEHNQEKFKRAKGGEFPGVDQAEDTFWQGVTPEYEQAKRRKGYEDWLMVRTGSLMQSMTTPEQFYQNVTETSAMFGTPLDSEDQMKYQANWLKRQLSFLDVSDKRMIRAHVSDYLRYGHDYLNTKNRFMAEKEEVREMDEAYGGTIG